MRQIIMNIKNPFGLKNNKIIHISDVKENGLDCNCVCPNCKEPLLACLGNKQIHHFRHYINDCGSGLETALYLFAKKVIKNHKTLKLPAVYVNNFEHNFNTLDESNLLKKSWNHNNYFYFDFRFPSLNKEFAKLFSDLNRWIPNEIDVPFYIKNNGNCLYEKQKIISEMVINFDKVTLEKNWWFYTRYIIS